MTWAIWLAVPVAVTVLAALFAWLRARPSRPPTPDQAMQAHRDYLDALSRGVRVHEREAHGRRVDHHTDGPPSPSG